MFERGIRDADVRAVLSAGEAIKEYPGDVPYPSRLLLGWIERGNPLHVVAADSDAEQATIVITVYEPDPQLWEPDFRRKRAT